MANFPTEQAPRVERMRQPVMMVFKSESPQYNAYAQEYSAIWEFQGKKIINGLENITGLEFREKQLIGVVGHGNERGRSYSGKLGEPIILRYNNRLKMGVLAHELIHRLMSQWGLFSKNKEHLGLTDNHQVLDLILYRLMNDLFGKEAALELVRSESSGKDPIYKDCWNKTMALTEAEREDLLKNILTRATKMKIPPSSVLETSK